jgi:5-methylcytosine-specific restriction endonuclease McrA
MESTSAHDLDRRLAALVRSERHLIVQFVVELAGFASRELYREIGYTSLFCYCVRQLGLSKSSAFRRSEVARLIVRFPLVADRMAQGRLSIRALVELREVLTEENHAGVLSRAEGMSQEEAQLLAVEHKPKPIPRDVVRALPAPPALRVTPAVSTETSPCAPAAEAQAAVSTLVASAALPAETSRHLPAPGVVGPRVVATAVSAETSAPLRSVAMVKPLTPDRYRLGVTVSTEFMADLEQVRAALSHKFPDGNFEQVVREAFKLVLERDRKRKALTERPRKLAERPPAQPETSGDPGAPADSQSPIHAQAPSTPRPTVHSQAPVDSQAPVVASPAPAHSPTSVENGRYIPAAVKRAVWERDQARCTWPMGDGKVCGAMHRLELDHDIELALGGKTTIGNLRLLCKGHNLMKAERHLGRAFMAKFRKERQGERDTS